MDCFSILLALAALVVAFIAYVRSGNSEELEGSIRSLKVELAELRRRLQELTHPLSVPNESGREAGAHLYLPPSMTEAPVVAPAGSSKEPGPQKAEEPQPRVEPQAPPSKIPVAIPQVPPPLPPTFISNQANEFRSPNFEKFLGTQLFLKVGVVILVIGVVFFLGYTLQLLGPIGKVLLGYFCGAGVLAAGLFAERKSDYRSFGRSIIAGAWGILYFVTFAAGFIDAALVIHTKALAVCALLAMASASVLFSLRYRNEWTTTAAFLLIFLSLGISITELEPAFNLSATAIVAGAAAYLAWRMRWAKLLALALPATWCTLGAWLLLRPILGGPGAVLAGLLGCWGAFQGSMLTWPNEEAVTERWLGLSQVLNFIGGFGLCLMESFGHGPTLPWVLALGFGLVHLGIAAAYAKQQKRALYLLTATEAIAALAFVTPLRLGMKNQLTPIMRLVGIELLLTAGVFLRERYFRLLAYGAFALTALDILLTRLPVQTGLWRLALVLSAAFMMISNAALLRSRWWKVCEAELPVVAYASSFLGTLFLGIAGFLQWGVVAEAWPLSALGLVWVFLGRRLGWDDFTLEGAIASMIALFFLLAGRQENGILFGGSDLPPYWMALLTLTLVFGAQDGLRRAGESLQANIESMASMFKPAAVLLLLFTTVSFAWLVKSEALALEKNLLVALIWAVSAVLYLERGRALGSATWRWLGHGLTAASFVHFLMVNLLQDGHVGILSLRVLTGLPFLGLMTYIYLAWDHLSSESFKAAQVAKQIYLWSIHFMLGMLVLYELHRAWVVPAWALLSLGNVLWGVRKERPIWRHIALMFAIAALVRGVGVNLYFRDEWRGLMLSDLTVPIAGGLLFTGYLVIVRSRREADPPLPKSWPWFSVFALLLLAFIWTRASGTVLTAWLSAYGLGIVILGFVLRERVARLSGLSLLSACILKLFFVDLRGLTGLPRVLSFIVLGVVLILVSLGYTRYKERMERLS